MLRQVEHVWDYAPKAPELISEGQRPGNSASTRPARPPKARLERVLPFQGAEWSGWAESPGRWPGLRSERTVSARALTGMRPKSPNKAGARANASVSSFSLENAIASLITKYLAFSCLVENEVHEDFCNRSGFLRLVFLGMG